VTKEDDFGEVIDKKMRLLKHFGAHFIIKWRCSKFMFAHLSHCKSKPVYNIHVYQIKTNEIT